MSSTPVKREACLEIQRLPADSIEIIARIDRSECIDYAYRLVDGALQKYAVEWDVPAWRTHGPGEHTVQSKIDTWKPVVEDGGVLLFAFNGGEIAGVSIVVTNLEPKMAWLAFMHVSRPYRRQGVGKSLWEEAETIARKSGASSMYVSAAPSGPTVDFYLGRGCELTNEPHPELLAMEPEDIHLIRRF